MEASYSMRTLEVTLISAKDLKDVNFFTRLSVYAVATLCPARPEVTSSRAHSQQQRQRTPADREGRRNPTWNCPLRFSVPVTDQDGTTCGLRGGPLALHFVLRAQRALGDRVVGEVHIPLAELEADCAVGAGPKFVSYQVRRPSGRGKGVLNFSYRFLDPGLPAPQAAAAADVSSAAAAVTPYPPFPSKADVDEPVTAYPVSSTAPHGVYPPPHPAAAYPPPPPYPGYPGYPPPHPHLPYGYAAPPPQAHAGYSYPPPPHPSFEPAYAYRAAPARPPLPPKRASRLGLGMGLVGGALGGMILGDAIADASDGGYDF